MLIVLLLMILLGLAYVLSTACRKGHPGLAELRGWAYAHRGLHGDGVPENSMEAFRRALEGGYGVELDVHLLADGQLAVIHDSLLLRTTGAEGCVESLTARDLPNYKLEGTDQSIPLFSQVVELFAGKAPLIVEIKSWKNNYAALCEQTCRLLDQYQVNYCMESFDPRCVHWLKKNRPDVIRGQLTENYFKPKYAKLPGILKWALKSQVFNFLLLPDFIAYRYDDRKCLSNFLTKKLWGAQSVAWTIKTKEDFDTALQENRIPIFEGFRP